MIRLSKFYLLVGLLLLTTIQLYSQEEENLDPTAKIIPPSPTVASLGKYGEIPVGMYTGTPNISIPLYTLQDKGLSVPISLSYHASGVKVDEVASWVGLGWSLNAGGVISRTVRGIADDGQAIGYFDESPPVINLPSDLNNHSDYIDGLISGDRDGQPDIYHYNVGGISGKFVLDGDKNVHHIPYRDDIELEWLSTGWILTTSAGVEYHFEKEETTYSNNDCEGSMSGTVPNITGWLLTKIVNTVTKAQIDFNYQAYSVTYDMSISQTKYANTNIGGVCTSPPTDQECLTQNTSNSHYISSIVSDFGSVEFSISSVAREDVSLGGVRLETIMIKDKQGTPIKYFDLGQGYFNQNATSNIAKTKRLKLISVTERSSSNEIKPPYVFDYLDENDHSDYKLPPRLSKAQDHWGYYNGATNNNSFIPAIPEDGFVGGADRSADNEHTKAGILERITYPTGGYNEFEYEAHDIGIVLHQYIFTDAGQFLYHTTISRY